MSGSPRGWRHPPQQAKFKVGKLPETASTLQYRIALAALNGERTKQALEIGVKVGKESLKGLNLPT
jgi:hypothetical protein